MKTKESKQKNLLIGGLLAIVLVMAVGYAAFATQLNITGTASFDNTWCLGFDSTKTSAYQATAGVSGGTVPTGSISFDGNTCATNYKTDASLTAAFKQPGDKIVYTLTIANKSTLTAAIKSIKVEDESVTADKTITKGNVKFTVEMPETTTLAANATTTMKVTAEFQNDTDINKYTTGETQTLDVEINAEQDDGNGGMDITPSSFTGSIYRYSSTELAIHGSQAAENGGTSSIEELTEGTDYTTNASSLNKNFYLKHDIVNDMVVQSYVCFITEAEHCLRYDEGGFGDDYLYNKGVLESQQSWFNSHSITCDTFSNYGGSGYRCVADNGATNNIYSHINDYTSGNVAVSVYGVGNNYPNCVINGNGSSSCS